MGGRGRGGGSRGSKGAERGQTGQRATRHSTACHVSRREGVLRRLPRQVSQRRFRTHSQMPVHVGGAKGRGLPRGVRRRVLKPPTRGEGPGGRGVPRSLPWRQQPPPRISPPPRQPLRLPHPAGGVGPPSEPRPAPSQHRSPLEAPSPPAPLWLPPLTIETYSPATVEGPALVHPLSSDHHTTPLPPPLSFFPSV